MAYLATKREILKVLEENLHNAHPQVVESSRIAEKLNLSMKELSQTIRMMGKAGEVESDQDCQRLVITREGLRWLDQYSLQTRAGR